MQYLTIFLCNIYFINLNALTANAQSSDNKLILTHSGGTDCKVESSLPKANCLAVNHYDKFSLECQQNPEADDGKIVWFQSKSKSEEGSLVQSTEKIDVDDHKLTFKSVDMVDSRFYTCQLMKRDEIIARESFEVQIIPRVPNIRKDVTAIEENPITLNCSVTSNIPLQIFWKVDTLYGNNATYPSSKDRIELFGNNTFVNHLLIIKSANMTLDRGSYTCWSESAYGNSSSTVFNLRVKSKYAALWPFLGICTEVIILCVIIIIYEKKRDQTELEESDTDQGPEMKNSPDHGQDNIRYRK